MTPADGDEAAALERAILGLLAERSPEKSICPSEAARRVRPDDWRASMDATRRVAAGLAAAGRLVVTQGGKPVDPESARGPIRLRLPRE